MAGGDLRSTLFRSFSNAIIFKIVPFTRNCPFGFQFQAQTVNIRDRKPLHGNRRHNYAAVVKASGNLKTSSCSHHDPKFSSPSATHDARRAGRVFSARTARRLAAQRIWSHRRGDRECVTTDNRCSSCGASCRLEANCRVGPSRTPPTRDGASAFRYRKAGATSPSSQRRT